MTSSSLPQAPSLTCEVLRRIAARSRAPPPSARAEHSSSTNRRAGLFSVAKSKPKAMHSSVST